MGHKESFCDKKKNPVVMGHKKFSCDGLSNFHFKLNFSCKRKSEKKIN